MTIQRFNGDSSLLSNVQQWALIILRIIIGWHLLNEGLVKLTGEWSAESFLISSHGLFLGIFTRIAVYSGILLLFLYYIAYPPLHGNDLLVNKGLVELVSLVILAIFPSTLNFGLWNLLKKVKFRMPFFATCINENPDLSVIKTNQSENPSSLIAVY